MSAYRCILLLCVLSGAAFAQQQTDPPPINDQEQLVYTLLGGCGKDPSCSAVLLRQHKDLINVQLWQRLIDIVDSGLVPAPALPIYDLAQQVAAELGDKRLVALTYYKK